MNKLKEFLFRPTDIAFLIYFRLFAGGFIAGEVINQLFTADYLNYIDPAFNFTYQFFSWVQPFPEMGMYVLFAVIILAAIAVMLGWMYRMASIVLFLSYTAMFLMEKSEYVNHFYLYCTLTFLLICMPADKAFSLDARNLKKQLNTVPAWMYYLLIFQMGVVYFYAGIAKLHPDWFQAKAMTLWMKANADIPLVGSFLAGELAPWLLSYAGLIFDLLIVPFLLWRKSRLIAFFVACFFHMSNVTMFGLATFPWFSLMMTALYFGPSWPRKLPILKKRLPAFDGNSLTLPTSKINAITVILLVYVFFQLTLPFRHLLYPGSPNWTEEGHRFAWHMMLRSKYPITNFRIKADGQEYVLNGEEYLTQHQVKKMGGNPEMILEFAHFLRDEYRRKGYQQVAVYAEALVSLNGRPMQRMIDPKTNLAIEKRSLKHYTWILPLKE